MRAKQLSIVRVSNNTFGSSGLASIIYNLAFAPKLIYLNISQCNIGDKPNEVVEALYKLFRITASLEILDASNISKLEFYFIMIINMIKFIYIIF